MILDLHGEALVGRIERRPLGHGPGFQHAFHLQAKIIVQARGVMLLHHEAVPSFGCEFRRRLWRLLELALSFVFFQCHGEHYLTTETQERICSCGDSCPRLSVPSKARPLPAPTPMRFPLECLHR